MRIILLLLISIQAMADVIVVKNLRQEWLQYLDGKYTAIPVEGADGIRTLYFRLPDGAFRGQTLRIRGRKEWQLFINRSLILTAKECNLNLDSLDNIYPNGVFMGIHSKSGVGEMETLVISGVDTRLALTEDPMVRPVEYFRDYSIISSALLLIFFLLLLRTNPQLTIDYFSFSKIFSVQERNENLASRITSSENLLFYVFCALLTGFLLTVILHFAGTTLLTTKHVTIHSFGSAVLVWIRLSLFVLILLAAKLIIVLLFSTLFNFTETVSFQFFNFLRFVLFTAIVLASLSLVYFLFRGTPGIFYERLIVLGLLLLTAGSVMVLIKLLARASFSFFHLFSYLCASEIIPLVIIIRIFF